LKTSDHKVIIKIEMKYLHEIEDELVGGTDYLCVVKEIDSGGYFIEELYYDLKGNWFSLFMDGMGRLDERIFRVYAVQTKVDMIEDYD